MVHLKDTIIYGEVHFEENDITFYNLPKVNNLPILLEEDLENDLFGLINTFHANTKSKLTTLKQKSTIAGASSK